MIRWLIVAAALALGPVAASAQDTAPVLRIETGTHTANVRAVSADAAGRVMVTASDDKTARIWSLPELRPLGVLRPPIGAGYEGRLLAVAVAPDGRSAAVGGYLGSQQGDVLLFDLQTRQVLRRWSDLPSVVPMLAFSADGQRLAAGLADGGIRVWSMPDGRDLFADAAYAGHVDGASFAPDGRLVTTCGDGFVRLYDRAGRMTAKVAAVAGKRPVRVAFGPDGRELAVGFADVGAVEIRDGNSLALLAQPDVKGLNVYSLDGVAWSRDGRLLYGSGDNWDAGAYDVLVWPERGRGARQVTAGGFDSALIDPVPRAGGSLAVASVTGGLAVIDAQRRHTAEVAPVAADVRTAGDASDPTQRFLLSADGRRVALSQLGAAGRWDVVDARGFGVTSATAVPAGLADWTSSIAGLAVTDWDSHPDPKLNGRPIALDKFEYANAAAVRAGRVLLGSTWTLRLFDQAGKQAWQYAAPGPTRRVNQSSDGRLGVAAFGDGTIRWFRMTDGHELLALFLTRDGKRWVAFTPSGYYVASPGGEALVGWQVNRGADKAGDFFPVGQFRDRFYRPDVVTRVLDTLDESEALKQADGARGAPAHPAAPLLQDLPPVIAILSPADGSTVAGAEATIAYSVRSPSGTALRPVRVLIDGRPAPAARGLGRSDPGPDAGETRGEITVAVPAGKGIEVALLAETATRVSEPARVRLTRAATAPAARAAAPTTHRAALYALVIGVADYKDPGLKLEYSGKDAHDFAAMLARNAGGLYREVQVKLLADRDATRDAVLDGLDWLRTQTTAEDVAVLFMAGHGTNDATGRVYFLPFVTDLKPFRSTAVAGNEVKDALSATPGRVVAFLDTCHSGSVLGGNFRSAADIDGLTNELSSAESGLVVFAGSTGRELSPRVAGAA